MTTWRRPDRSSTETPPRHPLAMLPSTSPHETGAMDMRKRLFTTLFASTALAVLAASPALAGTYYMPS